MVLLFQMETINQPKCGLVGNVDFHSIEYLFIYLMYCIQLSQARTNKCHVDVEAWAEVHQDEVCNVCSTHCLQLV